LCGPFEAWLYIFSLELLSRTRIGFSIRLVETVLGLLVKLLPRWFNLALEFTLIKVWVWPIELLAVELKCFIVFPFILSSPDVIPSCIGMF
jgi:hypothetical protein